MQTEKANLAHELSQQSGPHFLSNVVRAIEHVEQQLEAELEWVRGLRDEELAQREPHSSTIVQGDEKEKTSE